MTYWQYIHLKPYIHCKEQQSKPLQFKSHFAILTPVKYRKGKAWFTHLSVFCLKGLSRWLEIGVDRLKDGIRTRVTLKAVPFVNI